jgi:hypothetical protein
MLRRIINFVDRIHRTKLSAQAAIDVNPGLLRGPGQMKSPSIVGANFP